MRWRFIGQVVLGIALVVGILALGAGVYQAGFAAGVATEGGAVVAPPIGYGPGYGWGWHGGFGIFGFLGFFLFLFLLFALFRALAWGGRGWRGPGGYGRGPWGSGYGQGHDHPGHEGWRAAGQDWFDEWHRRAHQAGLEGGPGQGSGEPERLAPAIAEPWIARRARVRARRPRPSRSPVAPRSPRLEQGGS